MKKKTKDTINKLIERERECLYGHPIPDSTINDMIEDVNKLNETMFYNKLLIIALALVTIVMATKITFS